VAVADRCPVCAGTRTIWLGPPGNRCAAPCYSCAPASEPKARAALLIGAASSALVELKSIYDAIPREERSAADCLCVVGCRQMIDGAQRLWKLMEER
jgi:hypothetical protein